jgi:hypothetical protein
LNGAEADGDYRPTGALLVRVDQLKQIRGWEDFTARADWDADITVNSTGPLDLAWISRDLLLSLPGINEIIADQYLTFRQGPDGIDGTEDDGEIKSVEDVRIAFGLSPDQFKQLAPLVGFRDQVVRVVSVGRSGDVTRTVQMIIRKSANAPQLITWKEL